MSHVARNEIYFGQAITIDEICQKIRSVSRDDVVELADTLFAKGAMTLTLLGDFDDKFQIKNLTLPA
jgi:predicted Zn-dependent peptidase